MKKKHIVLASLAVVILLSAVTAVSFFSDKGVMKGICLVAENGSYLIVSENGGPICMSNKTNSEAIFENLQTGDKITVIHDEEIQETYPGGTGVYFCRKLEDGNISDIPQSTVKSLEELGWKIKE